MKHIKDDYEAAIEWQKLFGEGFVYPFVKPNKIRVAKSLLKLLEQIDILEPGRSKVTDGTIGDKDHSSRDSDHNPWVVDGEYGVVTALDITHDINLGVDCQKIVDAIVGSRDLRIKYVIWNKLIVNSEVQPWVWRDYKGKNPHSAHMHISVQARKELFDSVGIWNVS